MWTRTSGTCEYIDLDLEPGIDAYCARAKALGLPECGPFSTLEKEVDALMQICGDRSDCSGLVGRLGGGLSLCQEVPGSLQTCVDAPTCPVSLQAAVAKDGLASHSGSCAEAEDSCSKTCGVCDSKGVHIWAKPAGRLVADAAPRCVLIGQKQVGWFACANGLSCVAESAVLNQWFDCHDRSDEKSKPLSVLCDSLTLSHRAWVSRAR